VFGSDPFATIPFASLGGSGVTVTANVGTVTVSAPSASATIGVDVTANIGTVTVSSPTAAAAGGAEAAADVGTVTITAPTATSAVNESVTANIGTVTVTTPTASATGFADATANLASVSITPPSASVTTGAAVTANLGRPIRILAPTARFAEPAKPIHDNRMHEQVVPYVPAFMAYEKALVEWFGTIPVPRDDGHHERFKVEYAGGERAIRAIKSLKGDDARNEKVRTPLITIRLQNVEYANDRYHPPESFVSTFTDGPRAVARRAARISKPAPYRLTYDVQVYPNFEVDLRYAIGLILNKFHHHGGLSYLVMRRPGPNSNRPLSKEFFPLRLKGYSHGVDSNTGDQERTVRGSFVFEVEAYLGLPYTFVPTFRRLITEFAAQGGQPGEVVAFGPGRGPTTLAELRP
jgi:hypothetical protein